MSCSTQSSQPIRLIVTVGNFPEGYCPANYQQFAKDFAARLIVTPNQSNSTFVTGSVEPTSNVGPWLKNCEEWFVFDDSTGRYRPTPIGILKNSIVYDANSAFIVPDNIYFIMAEAWGGGGGGGNQTAGCSGGGGGAGGYGRQYFSVTPGQNIPITVGTGGLATSAGNSSSILTLTVTGGGAGTSGAAGAPFFANGGAGGAATGAVESITGGRGGAAAIDNGGAQFTGHGGDGPKGGQGGVPNTATLVGTAPAGGGCGGVSSGWAGGSFPPTGGAGANGRIIIYY